MLCSLHLERGISSSPSLLLSSVPLSVHSRSFLLSNGAAGNGLRKCTDLIKWMILLVAETKLACRSPCFIRALRAMPSISYRTDFTTGQADAFPQGVVEAPSVTESKLTSLALSSEWDVKRPGASFIKRRDPTSSLSDLHTELCSCTLPLNSFTLRLTCKQMLAFDTGY